MMRRSRISVRPNVARPGGRGLPGSQEGQHGQGAAVTDTTHAAGTERKEPDTPAITDPAQSLEPICQSVETGAGLNTSQDTTPEQVFPPSLGEDKKAGSPNGRPLTDTTAQRRKRFSVLPNLAKPRVTPALRTPKPPLPQTAAPPTPTEPPDHVPEDQVGGSGIEQGGGSHDVGRPVVEALSMGPPTVDLPSQAVLGDQVTLQDEAGPVSPAALTTSCLEPAPEKKNKRTKESLDVQSASSQSRRGSGQPVHSDPSGSCGELSPENASSREGPSKLHYSLNLKGSPEDRQKIAKARKLKEMMRLESMKERNQKKGKPHVYDYSAPLDHSKMTMRDLIHYLPDTNPMKSSLVEEQKPDEQFIPSFPSQGLPLNNPVVEEEEDEEDDDPMNDEMLAPKVRVAEDGSLVLDEESLTVRVKRSQGPSIVEGNDPIFERGSTTTYSSFRTVTRTKPWSDKETDMFYLAINMVGSDFPMICLLLPHRSRREVKNKFKKEEKVNNWRIDKAFREKRPFDLEFFSSLLQLVLAADKKKKKSNRSNPKSSSGEKPKRKRKARKASAKGATEGQAADDVELDSDVAEGDLETAEKENKDRSNVAKGTRKAHKRVKKSEEEEQAEEETDSAEKLEDGAKKKRRKKMANGRTDLAKGDDESQSSEDERLGSDVAEGCVEPVEKEKEKEDSSSTAQATGSTGGTRKKRKLVQNSKEEEEVQAEEEPDSTEKQDAVKAKRRKKMANGVKASLKAAEEELDVELGTDAAESNLEASEKENEGECDVTDATNTAKATRETCKRMKKGEEEEEEQVEEERASPKKKAGRRKGERSKNDNAEDGALSVSVAENEAAVVQSDAEEAQGSEIVASTEEEDTDKATDGPTKNIPDSAEKISDGSRREEEEGWEDADSLSMIFDGSAFSVGAFMIDGSIIIPTDEENPDRDLQGASDVSSTDGQNLINSSRFEGDEILPPPEAASPEGRGKHPGVELWPHSVEAHQESSLLRQPKRTECSEEEERDEVQGQKEEKTAEEVEEEKQAEEQASPSHIEGQSPEQVLVPLGLRSLELVTNELEFPASVPDAPGAGGSADVLCPEPGCEGSEGEGVELSEHHLDLLVDVMESLPPDVVAGIQAAESVDEVARTLLSLSDPALQLLSAATPIPEAARAHEPPHQAPVEQQEPESERADQSLCSGKPIHSVTSDLPIMLAPINEEDTRPTEEPIRSDLGESTPAVGNVTCSSSPGETLCLDSSVQNSAPLGRRSRFPKPRPNLVPATRLPHTPLRESTAPPHPGQVTSADPPTSDTELPASTEEEKHDPNLVPDEELSSGQTEGEGSSSEKVLQPGDLSTPGETSCSDSSVQNSAPLGRRSRFPKPRPNLGRAPLVPRPTPSQDPVTQKPVDDSSSTPLEEGSPLTLIQDTLTCSSSDPSAEVIHQTDPTEGSVKHQNTEGNRGPAAEAPSSSLSAPLGSSQPWPGPSLTDPGPGAGEESAQGSPASPGIPENEPVLEDDGASLSVDVSGLAAGIDAPRVCASSETSALVDGECKEGLSWADAAEEEEPTFILTLYEIPYSGLGERQTNHEEQSPAAENPLDQLTSVDPQAGPQPAVSEPLNCESLSVETAEAGSGCDSVSHLVLSDALIPVCEGQEEEPAQHRTGLPPSEEDHSSESHDPVESGTDGASERDTPSQEKRNLPVRTRRGKLQVKPCLTQRKLRVSVRHEQGLLPEEAEQPGSSHAQSGSSHKLPGSTHKQPGSTYTMPQTHPPTFPHPDAQQEDPAIASELPAVAELPQGIMGHSDLPQECVAAGAEDQQSSDGGEQLVFSCPSTQNSCESLSVETAEAGSGCDSVSHLVLSDALIPVCEGQEEEPAQHRTGLPPSDEDHSSQIVDPVVESHGSVEAGTDGASERDTPSREKRNLPVRTRRGKLQVKPCLTQRKLRVSVRDEQGLFPEEAEQPGSSHTQSGSSHKLPGSAHKQPGPTYTMPQTHPPTFPHPEAQQEEPAVASELPAVAELPQGIMGHSDLPQECVAAGAEDQQSSDGGEQLVFSCPSTQNSCESLSVETAEAGSGCDSVSHLVLSDALIPVCEGQEEEPAQHRTGLSPSEEDHSSQIVDPLVEGSLDPVVESLGPVESGTDGASERDTPSREKRNLPVRTRRGKLQVKPCLTQRKLRVSVRDEQGLLPQEAEQPGPSHTQPGSAHTSPQTHPPTVPHPDAQQEEPAVASELPAVGKLPRGIMGHSDLPHEEGSVAAEAEDRQSSDGGEQLVFSCPSTQNSCESLSVETAEAGSGCDSVSHLVLSDALIPVCEGQEEEPAQHRTGLSPSDEDHSSQIVDPVVESHGSVEAGTDGASERDTPSREKINLPVRTRRGKLQVKPCLTQRKLRVSVRHEQDLLPEEAEQPGPSHKLPGPAHTSTQTHPPTVPHADFNQEEPAVVSELPAVAELPQGIMGHSDLPQECVAAGAEDQQSSDGGEQLVFSCPSTQNSCESLSVETAEAGSGCDSVSHLVLSDALIPVCEGQEEEPAQHRTGLSPSEEEHSSQIVDLLVEVTHDPVVESVGPVESGIDRTSERDTPSREKRNLPVRTRRGKLQVKPCLTQRKLRVSLRHEQGLLPEEAEQPGPSHKLSGSAHTQPGSAHTTPQTHPSTVPHPDAQQEEPAAASELPAAGKLPQGIVGQSDHPKDEGDRAVGAEDKECNSGGEGPLLTYHKMQNSCESLSVETAEAGSGFDSVSHLVLSDALIPVCEGQEEEPAQHRTGLPPSGKLQVKPCLTQRKLRVSVRHEQGLLPEEAEQPGPSHKLPGSSHTSTQTHPPTVPHPDAQQDEPAVVSELPPVAELPQGIMGHSDLPQECVAAGAEDQQSSDGGEQLVFSCPSTQNSCESLSVETAEAGSGCDSVSHLVLSDTLIPVCEGQEEEPAQHRTGLSPSEEEHSSQIVDLLVEVTHDPVVESVGPVESGTDGASERDTPSREKRNLPVRTRRGKLQVKPCLPQRKLRVSVRHEQGLLPEEAEQPGSSHTPPGSTHTSPHTHPPTVPHPDAQQEEPAVASELPAVGKLPQGIMGHSDLRHEEGSVAAGAEDRQSSDGGEQLVFSCPSTQNSCESLSVETAEAGSGCDSVSHLVLSDALIPVCEGQEEEPAQHRTGLPPSDEDHSRQIVDPMVESHGSVEAGTDGASERDTPSREKRNLPVRTRRGKLQVKPCLTRRKLRVSVRHEQGLLPEEAEQPGPSHKLPGPSHKLPGASHTSIQTHPPTVPHADVKQEEPAVVSELLAVAELPQGIMGHSDLPQECVAAGAEDQQSSDGGEQLVFSCPSTQNSCESLSVETAEAGSGCDSVSHLILSDALIPVCEGQEEAAAQHRTGLPPSEEEHSSQIVDLLVEVTHDPVVESVGPVESGTDGASERDTPSREKRNLPVRSRRGKLQVKPCLTQRKLRVSVRHEQHLLPEEAEQPGPSHKLPGSSPTQPRPAHTSTQTHPPTVPRPDTQKEEPAVSSELPAVAELPQGIVGHSDLPQEEGCVAAGAEDRQSSDGGEQLVFSCPSTQNSCESLSVETAEAGSGCDSVSHLVLSDALIPVCEGQEEETAQHRTGLPPSDEDHSSQIVDPVVESHGSVESGTDAASERDTPPREKRNLPVRSRRGKLQVKPCLTQRKLRVSVRHEQGLLPEEAEQPGPSHKRPGPAHISTQTHPPTVPHADVNQEVPAVVSELPAVAELPQGIMGHSDLPQECVAAGAEDQQSSDGGEQLVFSCPSTQNSCESLSVETAEVGSGCDSVSHLVLSDALIPVCEEQEEEPAQHRTGTPPSEEEHSSQIVDLLVEVTHDPVVESVGPVESGTDGASERDTPSREKRNLPVRSRRGKLQVKPCLTQRKLRVSVRDEQGLLPEEADQPGPSHKLPDSSHKLPGSFHTSTQTHPPTVPHPDAHQKEPALAELPQGIMGHSDLPHEEGGNAAGAEDQQSSDRGEQLVFSCPSTQNSCESLSVETAEAGSGCDSVSQLVLSDALIPVCEGQEEEPEQHRTGLSPSEKDHSSQILDPLVEGSLDPVVESLGPVESGTDRTSERDTPSRKKRNLPVRTRRGKLQVKPCLPQRKLRVSVRHEQDLLPEEAEQPGSSHTPPGSARTSPHAHPPTVPHPDAQQEEPAVASELPAIGKLPQGIMGHSDLPHEEGSVAAGAEDQQSSDGGEQLVFSCPSTQNSCESLSVETAEAGSGCDSVSHLVLSDALIPVCEGQEEETAQHRTGLPPSDEDHSSQIVDPVVESHGSVEAGTDGASERDTPSREKRNLPVGTRRGKLQVKPCLTQRKLRVSVRHEQDLLPEEAEQPGPSHKLPGPAHTCTQTHPPTVPHSDVKQEEPAVVSELPAVAELPQGIMGHSDLPQECVAAGAEDQQSSDGGEQLVFSCPSTQNSCESLSVETAEARSGCDSVSHLVLSDALMPVCEGQEEESAQRCTGLPPSEEEHSSHVVDPLVVESLGPVESGTDGASERDTPSREKRNLPVRTRRGKLQVKPCLTQRKLRVSVRDEQGLLPEEAEQPCPSHKLPGPAHTSTQTHPPTVPHPDTQQEEPAVVSELHAVAELPQGIVGHSDLPQEEGGVTDGAEDRESSGRREKHSTPQSTSGPLTRSRRTPRGFLSFLPGSAAAGPASRPVRHVSQKASANTSHTGSKRTTRDVETSVRGSLRDSHPADVKAGPSHSEPSPEPASSRASAPAKGEFLCARPSETEDEPTNVSEFCFQDIFTEVQESD